MIGVKVLWVILVGYGIMMVFGYFGGVIMLVYDVLIFYLEVCYIFVWYE